MTSEIGVVEDDSERMTWDCDMRLAEIPVPRSWPEVVQRGWLCALGLAYRGIVSLAAATGGEQAVAIVAGSSECEARLLRARFGRMPPAQRPHYKPKERLEILEEKTRRGLRTEEVARRFLVTVATVERWLSRLDEGGEKALLAMRRPVNRLDDLVGEMVREVGKHCPQMGKKRIAQILARAGLRLAESTVARKLKEKPDSKRPPPPAPEPQSASPASGRTVIAKYESHVWGLDHTVVPTAVGFWVPWFPGAMLQVWPFCFWLSVVMDHFSRRILAIGVYTREPSGQQVCRLLDRARRRAGGAPKYTVTDQGAQFREKYRRWCERWSVKPRYGAVGKHGSIAIVERFWRSLKEEAFGPERRGVVINLGAMAELCSRYVDWYNDIRPHQGLDGATPSEVFDGRRPPHQRPCDRPRARSPDPSIAAASRMPRGQRDEKLRLVLGHAPGLHHLPVIELRKAA